MVDFTLCAMGADGSVLSAVCASLDSVLKCPSGCWTEVELLGTGKNGDRSFEGVVVVIRREVEMVVEMGAGVR